jgi:hypothetical protein
LVRTDNKAAPLSVQVGLVIRTELSVQVGLVTHTRGVLLSVFINRPRYPYY